MEPEILFEDHQMVVVKKPAGMLSQPDASGSGEDMVSFLEARAGGAPSSIHVVHRLDRGVGGVMVYAKTKEAAAALSASVAARQMVKEYVAVVWGVPPAPAGELQDLLYIDKRQGKVFVVDRMRSGVKDASLSYTLLGTAEADGQAVSLLKIRLGSGRLHQIRVQLSHRGMPILGDGKYGGRRPTAMSCMGIALWAYHLSFPYPRGISGKGKSSARGAKISFSDFVCMPEEVYPFSLFSTELQDKNGL